MQGHRGDRQDRVGIIDEQGRYVNQLQVMALFAMYLLEKRGMRGDIVRSVTTSGMSTTARTFAISIAGAIACASRVLVTITEERVYSIK